MERVRICEEKGRKGLLHKTWKRCVSIGRDKRSPATDSPLPMQKTKSWSMSPEKRRVAPEGCFSVYVGPEKERFVIKTEHANHPLFRMLLEEAEMEYGHKSEGPIELPCDVDLFRSILWEVEQDMITSTPCNFIKGYAGYHLLSPFLQPAMVGPYL